MTSQQEVINNVNDNTSLDDKQKQLAVNAGVPEDAFVYTAAGWVYTGDPQKLVDTFNQANSNMFDNAVTTYQNEPNDTNRENVNQMAQMMGASGQNIDISQFQGYDVNYDQSYVSQEGLQALEDYSKGLIASAEGVEELFLKQQDLQKAMKGTDKEFQSSARAMVKLGHEEIEAQKKFDKLTESINDNIEVLKKGDDGSVEYKEALSKVGSAMADVFGDDAIDENFLKQNMEDIIAFAEGDEEAFKRLSNEIRSNGLQELTNQLNEVDGLMVDTEGLAAALNEATISIDGEADMSDIFNQLVAVYGSADDAAAAIESLGGYQVSFDQYEDENGNITYKAKVADTFRRAQRKNFGGGGGKKSGGGGSKEKEKYWDNPYDELYNLLEDQNEALRTREKLEREYDRILKRRTSTAQELKQNSLDEIANLQRELDIQRQIQAGRRRMINELAQKTHRDEEGNERTFADWGVTKYGWYDEQNGVMRIDWNAIDQVNNPELGGAIEAYISKLEELSQSFEETQTTIESMEDMIREIKERNMQEYLEFEERVYQAIIDREQKVIDEYKELTKHIADNLQKLIVGNYTLKQTERKLEEFLVNLKDNYMIMYQKNKNNFDMYENDYIFKTQFIKYLLDVVNYMTKLFSNMKTQISDGNNCVDDNKKSQIELAENLLKFCNNKIYEYSKKYNKNKNISIFSFMNGNVMKSQSFDSSKMNEFDDINETIKFEASHRGNKKYKTTNDKNTTINNIFSKEIINDTLNNTSNNETNELTFINLDQELNITIPIIPENVISKINKDISDLYLDITNFLKEEYNKIIQINKLGKEKGDKNKISTNLNLIILDKIKSFCEESFNYLLANHKKNEQHLNIKKKLRLILNNIDEYKNQFNLDKYLQKSRTKKDIKNDLNNSHKNYDNPMLYKTTLKNTYSFNNYINKNNDITNLAKTTYKVNKNEKNEIEEQKQSSSIEDVNSSKSFNNNSNYNTHINGRFNNFFRQYSSNALAEEITNPILYKFFNYKKNKYELDKSLGKFSMP